MPNSDFNIRVSYGAFDDDLCWEAHAKGTDIYVYSRDLSDALQELGQEISKRYPLDVHVPSTTLDDIFDPSISAHQELDIIRLAVKQA